MDVKPTPAHRTAEVESTKIMINRVEAQFDVKPERFIGDTAYGRADAGRDGRGKGHRAACGAVGQNRA